MTRVDHTIEIERPIDEVFDFITDPVNDPVWLSSVLDVRAPGGPIGVGSEFLETMRFLGRRVEVTWRVSEHEPPVRSAAQAIASPVPVNGAFQLERLDGGTRLTISMETDAHGFFALAEPVFRRMAQREIAANAGHLKDLLEAGAEPS